MVIPLQIGETIEIDSGGEQFGLLSNASQYQKPTETEPDHADTGGIDRLQSLQVINPGDNVRHDVIPLLESRQSVFKTSAASVVGASTTKPWSTKYRMLRSNSLLIEPDPSHPPCSQTRAGCLAGSGPGGK